MIVINPAKEEVDGMKAVMKAKKAKAKAEKVRGGGESDHLSEIRD